jgi:hypothetical protein
LRSQTKVRGRRIEIRIITAKEEESVETDDLMEIGESKESTMESLILAQDER